MNKKSLIDTDDSYLDSDLVHMKLLCKTTYIFNMNELLLANGSVAISCKPDQQFDVERTLLKFHETRMMIYVYPEKHLLTTNR